MADAYFHIGMFPVEEAKFHLQETHDDGDTLVTLWKLQVACTGTPTQREGAGSETCVCLRKWMPLRRFELANNKFVKNPNKCGIANKFFEIEGVAHQTSKKYY